VLITVAVDQAQAALLGVGTHTARLSFRDTAADALLAQYDASIVVTQLTAGGWTTFEPSADSRIVYVSSSGGDDANDGLSELAPKATIAAGLALMRHGYPDWLLLKKGDVFGAAQVPPGGFRWRTSGRSDTEPTLFSSYGPAPDPRPRIETGGQAAIFVSGGGGTPNPVAHVAFVGLDLSASPRTGTQNPHGINFNWHMDDVLIEDCRIAHFFNGITAQNSAGRIYALRIRRNVVHDCYSLDSNHAQGIYCDEVTGLLIEENVIDHGGWTELDPNGAAPDIFKHGVYVQGDAREVVFRNNIVSNSSSHGAQLRSGGIANDNVFVRNSVALLLAGDGEARGNVVLDGKDITPALPRRQGIHVQNVPTGALISHNVVANSTPGPGSKAIVLQVLVDGASRFGMRNVILEQNVVYGWGGEALDFQDFAGTFFESVIVRDNDFQNLVDAQELVQHQSLETTGATAMSGNRYHSASAPAGAWASVDNVNYSLADYLALVGDATSSAAVAPYPDPASTIGAYHASVGGAATHAAFVAEALLQSKSNWRAQYTAQAVLQYVRDGFAVPAW
jgi:hypothetical protein